MFNYKDLLERILAENNIVDSRLGPTYEVLAAQVSFPAGFMVSRPKYNSALGFMELCQLVGGVYEPDHIKRVSPGAQMNLFGKMSAYGPRIYNEHEDSLKSDYKYLFKVVRELRDNPGSRQIILHIAKSWDPPEETPCTLSIQFICRNNVLNAIVTMRSWDAVRGLPYDIMMFGGLIQVIAYVLKMSPGDVIVNAGSLHIYKSDLELIPFVNRTAFFSIEPDLLCSLADFKQIFQNLVYCEWYTKVPPPLRKTFWQNQTNIMHFTENASNTLCGFDTNKLPDGDCCIRTSTYVKDTMTYSNHTKCILCLVGVGI